MPCSFVLVFLNSNLKPLLFFLFLKDLLFLAYRFTHMAQYLPNYKFISEMKLLSIRAKM